MRGTFAGCWASARTAPVSSITATRNGGAGAFFIAHLDSSVIYHADSDKEKRNLRRKATTFLSREKPRFCVRLSYKTRQSRLIGLSRRRSLNGTILSNPDWGNVCKLLLSSPKKTSVFPF